MGEAEYEFLLNDSRARAAIVEAAVAPRVLAAWARCPWLRTVLVVGGRSAGAVDFDEALGRAKPLAEAAPTTAEDIVYWGYTSGSTGRPKAAVHTHQAFVAAAELVGANVFGIGADDLIFSASKLYFAFGLGNALYFPARAGAASVLVAERLTAERALAVIDAERPTMFFAVPTLYARMLEVPDVERRFDLSSLRFGVSSGEALPPAIFEAWADRFGLELVEVVGSTEALHDFIANRPGAARPGAAGTVVDGFEARLVDDAGAAVPAGRHRPPAGEGGHDRALLLEPAGADAPDHARRVAAHGRHVPPGRRGMVLLRGALRRHAEGGRAVGVAGRGGGAPRRPPGRAGGRRRRRHRRPRGLVTPRACVVLKSGLAGSPALAAELREHVRGRAAGYKVPGAVEFVADLPRTATGKVQRFRLRRP